MNPSYSKESNDNFFKKFLKDRFNNIVDIEQLKDDYKNFTLSHFPVDDEIKEKIIKKFDNITCKSNEFKIRFGQLTFKEAFIKNYYRYTKQPRCCFCGQILEKNQKDNGEEYIIADIEHILPKSLFPQFALHPSNWVPCCKECNQAIKGDKFFKEDPFENFKTAIEELGLSINNLHPLKLWKSLNINYDKNNELKITINPNLGHKAKELLSFYDIELRAKIIFNRCYNILWNIIKHSDIRSPESLERLLENMASSNWHEVNDGYSLNNSPQIWQKFIENILYDECKLMALWDEVKYYNCSMF